MRPPCRGNTSKLISLMSGSLRPRAADRLRRHMQGCPGCREAFERLTKTQQLCRELGEEELPSLPWRKIEAQVYWRLAHTEGEPPARPFSRLLAFAGAATVGALAALVVVWVLGPRWAVAPRHATPVVVSRPVPPAPVAERELAAVPTMIQGDVQLIDESGSSSALRLDRPVTQGSRVATAAGARAALQWLEGSGLLLSSSSEVEIRRLMSRTQQLELERGSVRLRLARLPAGGRFAVEARGVRTVVQGTVFNVAIAQSTVDVEVYQGLVRVEPTRGGWTDVEVPSGFGVRVPFDAKVAPTISRLRGGHPTAHVHLVRWPDLARMMASTGLLTLESHPSGADLMLDSTLVGNTTLSLRGDPGRHLVELYQDGKLLDKRWVELEGPESKTIRIRPRDTMIRLPERIHRYIKQRAVQIRSCYERHLKRNPELSGKLTFRITIDANGEVTNTDLLTDTFGDSRVGQCAQIVIQRWAFPPGKAVQVVYPFIFRPQ